MTCEHRWEVESPEAARTRGKDTCTGRCALCKSEREFPTYGIVEDVGAPKAQWNARRKPVTQPAGVTRSEAPEPAPAAAKPWREMTPAEHKAFVAAHADELRRALGEGPDHLTNAQIEAQYTIPEGSLGGMRRELGIGPCKQGPRPKRAPSPSGKPGQDAQRQPAAPVKATPPAVASLDTELAALRSVAEALEPLGETARERVIIWAEAKYGGH